MVPVPGGKIIEEYVGHASSGDDQVSVAHMLAPAGWEEPSQEPEFDELTIVLEGAIDVEHDDVFFLMRRGPAGFTRGGTRFRYTTTHGARYIAVCLPAFHGDLVHREDDDEYDRHPVE
jgi:mannose-6-phosphate isomerase-like protein (cupin superfamily)